jgi:ubiquinone/menaquinone biosynthesis C-methylase UbiE
MNHPAHGHHHPADGFDWEAMADRLELDAAITEPIVLAVIPTVDGPVEHVLDVGSGPGAVALTLALGLPGAEVIAMDSSAALLHRAHHRAVQHGVTDRLLTLEGDLDDVLPPTGPMDLVWASMVLHHVADPVAALRRLRERLRRDGTLVMVEFGDPPNVLPDGDPLLTSGAWQRFRHATAATLTERLGLDPVSVDWPALLAEAGFDDITDDMRTALHPTPLVPVAQHWLEAHVAGGLVMAAGRIDDRDVAALEAFAREVPHRTDLAVTATRRVLTARPA